MWRAERLPVAQANAWAGDPRAGPLRHRVLTRSPRSIALSRFVRSAPCEVGRILLRGGRFVKLLVEDFFFAVSAA